MEKKIEPQGWLEEDKECDVECVITDESGATEFFNPTSIHDTAREADYSIQMVALKKKLAQEAESYKIDDIFYEGEEKETEKFNEFLTLAFLMYYDSMLKIRMFNNTTIDGKQLTYFLGMPLDSYKTLEPILTSENNLFTAFKEFKEVVKFFLELISVATWKKYGSVYTFLTYHKQLLDKNAVKALKDQELFNTLISKQYRLA